MIILSTLMDMIVWTRVKEYIKYIDILKTIQFGKLKNLETKRNIKVINVTNKDSLLNEKLDLVKNVKHSYYLIYNNKDYITHIITNEHSKIISYYSDIILRKGQENENQIKPEPFYLDKDLKFLFKD
nr:hypothetical protein [uncultured Flavobacterium sp.]